jgi:hypothetical protein
MGTGNENLHTRFGIGTPTAADQDPRMNAKENDDDS